MKQIKIIKYYLKAEKDTIQNKINKTFSWI